MATFRVLNPTRVFALALAGTGATVATTLYLKKNQQHAKCATGSSGPLNYPASCNYPDLTKHNNIMASNLSPCCKSGSRLLFY